MTHVIHLTKQYVIYDIYIRWWQIIVILSRYIKFLCFPVQTRRGWWQSICWAVWGGFVSLKCFFFAYLYFSGHQQSYTFYHTCKKRHVRTYSYQNFGLHLVLKTLSELKKTNKQTNKKQDKTRSPIRKGLFGNLIDQPHMACWWTTPTHNPFFIQHC